MVPPYRMRIPRFHLDAPLAPGSEIALPIQAATHAVRVLRLQPGDAVTLFNGDGSEYAARLVAADSRHVAALVEARQDAPRESPLAITLAQALARGEKMDWIVQKATELGVAAIVPVTTDRSEVRLDPARAAARIDHWRAVAISACEQSGRMVIPRIGTPVTLDQWLATLPPPDDEVRLALHPDAVGAALRMLRPVPGKVTLAVGPEGGFSGNDLAALRQASFGFIALGPRTLRTETAGVAAVAALQALYGDL